MERSELTKSKVKSMIIIFFVIRPGRPHTTKTFYGDSVKMCKDFTPNFGDERTGCCITTDHLTFPFFTRELLTVVLYPPYSPDLDPCDFSVSPIQDKTGWWPL
jgi:hypothetical protein